MYELLKILAISLLTHGQPHLKDVDHHINIEADRIIICLNGWCIDSDNPHADEFIYTPESEAELES